MDIYKLILDNRIADHIIYNYINDNDINYTKNNNGIFFNISCLDDNQNTELYKLINDYIKNIESHNKEINDIQKLVTNTKLKKKEEQKYEKLDIVIFNNEEKRIINLSRKF